MKAALLLLVLVVSVAHGASDRSLMVPAGPVGAAGAAPSYDAATDTWRPLEPPPAAPAGAGDLAATGDGPRTDWTFGPNVRVREDAGGNALWPDLVALPDGKLVAIWMDDRTNTYKIYDAVSLDGGASWSGSRLVDDAPASAMARFARAAVLSDGSLGVVWEDVRAGGWNWNVRFARGVWNPVSQRFDWSPSAGVNTAGGSTDAGSYMHPMIAAGPAGRVYVAWTDWREGIFNQVYFRASSDFGATWGTESRVSDEIGYQPVAGDPSLIVDPYDPVPPQDLYCVFNDWRGNVPGGRYPNVFFSRSTDGGATWGVNVEVNDITDWYQQASARVLVATPNRTLACGWFCDDFSGPTEMRVSLSTDSGATWQASAAVSTPAGCDVVVNLAPGLQNDLLASWAASYNIFFRGSTDAGLTWSDAIPADDAGPGYSSGNPSLAALPSGDPRIVMMDSRPSGAWEVWIAPGVRESAGVEDVAADLAGFALRASPNPLRSRTELAWSLPSFAVSGRLQVLDLQGRILREEIVSGTGSGRFSWDGRSARGAELPAGVYMVRLDAGGATRGVRVVKLR